MPYQQILGQAWQIFKRQRALWLFGFLSACTGGVYGHIPIPTFSGQTFTQPFQPSSPPSNMPLSLPPAWDNLSAESIVLIALGILALALVWIVFALTVRALAEPALLRGILADIQGSAPLTVSAAYAAGRPFFGRMLAFYLVIGGGGLSLALLITAVLGVLTIATHGIGLLCFAPMFLLLVPLGWLLELYLELTTLALVLEDLPLGKAFQRGWQVFKQNFWHAVAMGLILTAAHFLFSLLVGVVLVTLFALSGGLLIGLGIAMHATGGTLIALLFIGGILGLLMLLTSLALSGLLQTYLQSAWSLTYITFTTGSHPPAETSGATPATPAALP